MDINEEAYAIQEEVVEFRRALHRCPEIAFHETMTMEYIREHLEEWEISYKIFDPSGIIAVVGNGKKETIALRADMDALEVQEETGLDFASLNHGCMHACGHDGHTAILLATAKILKKHESELDRRVYLVFQPAEETAEGARFMLKTGVLDSVKRIYGVHIFNGIPSGKISLEAGPRMAATNWLAVHLYGRSGHAGKTHEGIDTSVAVSSMDMNFHSIINRNLTPLYPAVLTIGKVEAGTARNVIAGEAKIEGTARTFSRQAQEMIESRVKEIAKAHEQMYGVDVSVDFQQSSHGALINDPGVVEDVMEKAGEVFDPSEFTHVEAMMLGEDFANYLELYRKYKKDYGLEKIIETRMDQKAIGFNADIKSKNEYNIGDVLKHALPQDFVKFGLIPEFIGRVPVTVSLDMLARDALIRILKEPKNALTRQYEKLFELDDVKLTFQDGAIQAIAKRAIERGTGARGIRAIIESVMMNAMYEVPSDEDAVECIITEAAAKGEAEPILVTKNDERREISSDSNAKDEIA